MPTLDWLNRASAFTTAAQVPYRLLEQVSAHGSTDTAHTDNLLIQGDNLEALKALLPFYRGQVKCIFIDPPYNTKSAFEHYDDNLEHAQWLSMMLPRLQLLRELLREDGSIWVTIDDNEGHYLKVLMDEVFGRGNFVANVVWQKKYAPANDALWLSDSHDHVLVYAKCKETWRPNKLPRTQEQDDLYKNPDNDTRGVWMSDNYTCAKNSTERPNLYYQVENPNTGEKIWPKKTRVWAFDPQTHQQHVRDNLLYWGKDGINSTPRYKKFLTHLKSTGRVATTIWLHEETGHNQDANREQQTFAPDNPFKTPKPEQLIFRILTLATNPGDLVLDSFLGSGTTAAVAHKMGRRWIGIEMGAHAATHCLPRLQKVIDGEQGGVSKAVDWNGGGGFRFMRLGAPVFDAKGRIHPDVRFATLAAFVWQQETGTALEPAAAKTGTPYLGTHYTFDSCLRTEDGGSGPISLIKTPQVAAYLLFNGILGDKRPASGNVLTQAVLDALLALHAQVHPEGLGGGAFCVGQGGDRAAGGGHEAERSTTQAASSASIPLLVFGEACRLGAARLKLANVTFKHIPYDVKAR